MKITREEMSRLECIYGSRNSMIYLQEKSEYSVPVVYKILRNPDTEPHKVMRFRNEYALTKGLDCSGVRKVLGLEELEGKPVLVLEYAAGVTFDEAFVRQRRDIGQILKAAAGIAASLAHIHQHGIIHKDLNSNNVIVDLTDMKTTIIDFGIASVTDVKAGQTAGQESISVGTLDFISPEQTGRINRVVDYRTDFYSFGVMLYQALTGRLPFAGKDVAGTIHAHIAEKEVPVHVVNADVPLVLSDIVAKLMAKSADERYQSAIGIGHDLKECMRQWNESRRIEPFKLGNKDFSGKLRVSRRLYGRAKEIQTLELSVECVVKGGAELLLICGATGVGKSALGSEARRMVDERGGLFIGGVQNQYQQNTPYHGLVQALDELIEQILMESPDELDHWRKLIVKAVGEDGKLLTDLLPVLELVIGVQPPVEDLASAVSAYRLNQALQNLLKAVSKRRPLVVFIDNLQWIDTASLDFLHQMMGRIDNHALLFIGAYRDTEVLSEHPLRKTLEAMSGERVIVNTIHLSNLTRSDLNEMLADMMESSVERCGELAGLLHEKIGGNPFFFIQFLQTLLDEKLIEPDFLNQQWRWNLADINRRNVPDDEAVLMVDRIGGLPQDVLQVVLVAACIGEAFDLGIVAQVAGCPVAECNGLLRQAIDAGVVMPLDNNFRVLEGAVEDTALLESRFEFSHPRIWHAAYTMLSRKERRKISLSIGRLLLAASGGKAAEKQVFTITDYYNQGFQLIKDREELLKLVELNLQAGRKARRAGAYREAIWYLSMGIGFLDPSTKWSQQRLLAMDLYCEAIEAELMSSTYERAEQLANDVLQHTENQDEEIRIRQLQILLYTEQNRNDKAIEVATQALSKLGIYIPLQKDHLDDYAETLPVAVMEEAMQLENPAALPVMKSEKKLTAMWIMMNMMAAAHRTRPELLPVITLTMVRMSLKHGNSPYAAIAYGWFALLQCTEYGDIEKGHQFGKLSLAILEQSGSSELRAKVHFLFSACVQHWSEPVAETLTHLHHVYKYGMKSGDIEYAYYGAGLHCNHLFFLNEPLDKVQQHYDHYLDLTDKYRFVFYSQFGKIWAQAVDNLIGGEGSPSDLKGDRLDALSMTPKWREQNNSILLFCAYACQSMLKYIFGCYEEAVHMAQKAEEFEKSGDGFLYRPMFFCYYALAMLAHYHSAKPETQKNYLAKIRNIRDRVKVLAKYAPANYQNKFDLIEAELARIDGDYVKAIGFFGKAVLRAQEQKYIFEAAIAYEREAALYESLGREDLVRYCLVEARTHYRLWGAGNKVRDLEQVHQGLLMLEPDYLPLKPAIKHKRITPIGGIPPPSTSEPATSLDMLSIFKTMQVLSQELHLGQLLNKLVKILIESAGAEIGVLMEARGSDIFIQARGECGKDTVEILEDVPLYTSDSVPTSVVNYVARTFNTVLRNNPATEGAFTTDPYIIAHQPRSMLCLPMIYQSRLVGVLYLENNLTTDAFTLGRLELLNALSAHAAISLENARLYVRLEKKIEEQKTTEKQLRQYREHLEDEVAKRTTDLEKAYSELKQAKESAVAANKAKSAFFANMSHELRTPLNAILGFSQIMARDASLPEKQRDKLAIVLKSGGHLLSLIDSILDLAKIEAGKIEYEPAGFDLGDLLKDLVTMLRVRAEAKGLSLVVDQSSSFPRYIRSDVAKLRQIIINLVGNAIKFTEHGSITIRLSVLAKEKAAHGQLLFEVSDTGIGLVPEDQERIFRPFDQVKRKAVTEGTGLGLTITREYVHLLGGDINVESKPGQGSTFRFTIAYEPVEAGEIFSRLAPNRIVTGVENAAGRRILIAEDQSDNRLLLCTLLEPLGFELREAVNGQEALQIAREWRPHLILMDRRMPVMDGLTATRELRKLPEFCDVPVVAVTAHAFLAEQQEMLDAGCNDFLRKPFQEHHLYELLERYLGLKFFYKESKAPAVQLPAGEIEPISVEALARLPESLRQELETTLLTLETTEIEKVIARISEQDPALGARLSCEAQRFAYTVILTALRNSTKGVTP